MRITATLAALFICTALSAQHTYITKDTTINGYNARVTYDPGRTDSAECIISYLGALEVGSDTSKLGSYGPSYWLQQGWNGAVVLGNGTHWPIYITLQMPNQSTQPPLLLTRINTILARWKVKARALYFTGYSAGGWQALEFVSYQPTSGDHSYAKMVRAVLGIESVKPASIWDGTPAYPQNMVQCAAYTHVWGFDQINDGGRDMNTYMQAMNTAYPGSVLYYQTQAGSGSGKGSHCCFSVFTDPSLQWVDSFTNPNIYKIVIGSGQPMNTYQWLLRQGDTSLNGGNTNQPPVVTGSGGGTITLPTNSKSLSCSVVDEGGALTYAWSKTSGPSTYTINSPTSQSTTVSNLVAGTYVFQILVTDTGGLSGSDNVTVTVSNGANVPPVANAGTDQTITLPTPSVSLDGSASYDPDGTISTYQWTQIFGSAVNIVSPSQSMTTVNGFTTAGTYQFRLNVTDNSGASTADTVQVTVISNNTGQEIPVWVYIYDGNNPDTVDKLWDGWNATASATFTNMVDIYGNLQPWQAAISAQDAIPVRDNGATYGNGQTLIYPQGIIRKTSYSSGGPRNLTIGKLSQGQRYTLEIMPSRGATVDNVDTFTVGADSRTINTRNNYTNVLTFPNISPDSNGNVVLRMAKATGNAGTYINAFKFTQQGAAVNTNPTATVGQNQLISLPQDSTIITGSGTDPDTGDSVVAYQWQVISGPRLDTLSIDSPANASTWVKNLVVGTYVFQLTVTDTRGGTGSAQMSVQVTSATGAVSIVAPRDTVMPLSQKGGHGDEFKRDSTQIVVTASAGPNVTNYQWTKISGGNATILSPNTQSTNILLDSVEGVYSFQIKGYNLTDSAKDTVVIRVRDYQKINDHGCRTGAPVTHILTPTNTTQLIKTNLYNTQAALGDTIRGGDTIKIPRNPNNNGWYSLVNVSGVRGSDGCPVHIRVDTTVNVKGTIRLGNGNDSSETGYIDADFRIPSKNILYGMVNSPDTATPSANGIVMNYTHHTSLHGLYTHNVGIGMFIKNNPDSAHPPQIFNDFRFYMMEISYNFFDGSVSENNYIGNTSPDGITGAGGDGPSTRVDTILYHDNIARRSGYDGVQIVNAVYEDMYNNWVMYTGQLNASSQRYMSQMGGNTTGKVHDNFFHNGKEGVTGTPYGQVEYARNIVDSVYTGGTGAGRSHGLTMYGGLCGPVPGSTVRENRDSTTFNLHDNLVFNSDSDYIRIHNFQNFNSINFPSTIHDNWLIDSTGRTLAQLLANSSGTQYNTNNHLVNGNTFKIRVTDLSTQYTGPLVMVTVINGASTVSQTFTSPPAAYQFVYNQLVPPTTTICNCLVFPRPVVIKSN